ncbi:MAG TPA: carboxypeptidase regulatory-like domain-containing protein, partial [Tepidisphaeraceae bacterium]|nr:carboxypeptidase regulatory-like domain-containing protein [Tepidisphaeraceae bacterium]
VNENGTLKNVFVYVSSNAPQGPVPAQPAKLDQKGCQYVPHVIGVMVGQPISISNSDQFLHNVHSLAVDNPAFNFGQPSVDPGKKVDPMKVTELFKVKCDVHPWMGAWVHVLEHPYFAVTGDDGSFNITGLPPGQYKLTAWHETLGKKELDVTVEAGKPAAAEFTFEKQ